MSEPSKIDYDKYLAILRENPGPEVPDVVYFDEEISNDKVAEFFRDNPNYRFDFCKPEMSWLPGGIATSPPTPSPPSAPSPAS